MEVLLALSTLLAPGDDGSLQRDIALAFNQPALYLQQHPETEERDVDANDPSLPWLALVDGLLTRHVAAEIDHRSDVADVNWNLSQLRSYALLSGNTRHWLETAKMEGTEKILRALAPHAKKDGLVVATMDIDSDSYVILILSKPDYEQATKLAAKLGYSLKHI
ncbi:MAG TPA: hypothetical protein VJ901_10935 [Thermoanaerobaculia bacterium]|nr:hypothetical protein [Thermoanaerobaculia bacterium]